MNNRWLKRRDDDHLLSRIVALWPLVVAVVGGIVSASFLQFRVNNHEERIVRVEASVAELQGIKANTQLLVDVLVNKRRDRDRDREARQ